MLLFLVFALFPIKITHTPKKKKKKKKKGRRESSKHTFQNRQANRSSN